MARCRKCNAVIPDGKELCAQCEQLNREYYLDSLLHSMTSDDKIAQGAKNVRKNRSGRTRKKSAPSNTAFQDTKNKPDKTVRNTAVQGAVEKSGTELNDLTKKVGQEPLAESEAEMEISSAANESFDPDMGELAATENILPELEDAVLAEEPVTESAQESEAEEAKDSVQVDGSETENELKPEVEETRDSVQADGSETENELKPEVEEARDSVQADGSETENELEPEVEEAKDFVQVDGSETENELKPEVEEARDSVQAGDSEMGSESQPEVEEARDFVQVDNSRLEGEPDTVGNAEEISEESEEEFNSESETGGEVSEENLRTETSEPASEAESVVSVPSEEQFSDISALEGEPEPEVEKGEELAFSDTSLPDPENEPESAVETGFTEEISLLDMPFSDDGTDGADITEQNNIEDAPNIIEHSDMSVITDATDLTEYHEKADAVDLTGYNEKADAADLTEYNEKANAADLTEYNDKADTTDISGYNDMNAITDIAEHNEMENTDVEILDTGEEEDVADRVADSNKEETVEEVIKEFLGESLDEPLEGASLEAASAQDDALGMFLNEGGADSTENLDKEVVPQEAETMQAADFMEQDEENQNDKYIPDTKEENIFGFDSTDAFGDDFDNEEWEDNGYDILGDDTASDDEFDRMLKVISDTENAVFPENDAEAFMALTEDTATAKSAVPVAEVDVAGIAAISEDADAAELPDGTDTKDFLEENAEELAGTKEDLQGTVGTDPADNPELAGTEEDLQGGAVTDSVENPELPDIPEENMAGTEPDMDALFPMDEMQEETFPLPDSTDMFPMPEDADDINNRNTSEAAESEIQGEKENSMAKNEDENLELNDGGEAQEDILDLINSIYSSEEGEPSDETENEPAPQYGTEDSLGMGGQDDMTDFFADLPDEEFSSIEEIASPPEEEQEDSGKKKKKDKKKGKKKEKKPNIFKRIFGNVRPERTEEEVAQMKEKVIADAEAKEAAEEEKKKKAAAEKEAKKKKAADDKAAADKKKQENAKKKAEAAKAKQEAKKEAKEKKDKKKQEVQNLIDAIDENEGRINRVGASIVFIFFAAVAITIIIGTKIYAYSQNIENAQKSFEYKHYDEAYEEIAGINVKEEDEPFVLKVMVVMYTNKQLNSFNHYYAAELYPEALDSLLKGLERYDKYTALASVAGVTQDLDQLRVQILEKLDTIYSVSEKEAMNLNSMSDHTAYTERVYEIAGKIAKKPKSDEAAE